MKRTLAYATLITGLIAALACGGTRKPAPVNLGDGTKVDGADLAGDLLRDLEATVLENYSQLTLGNYRAYMESVSRTIDLTLIGAGAGDVQFGSARRRGRRSRSWIRTRPYFRREGVRIYSKNLRVWLSSDEQVGWISDEVSYRVPFMLPLPNGEEIERVASIPFRVTAAFVRDVDRWVMVMEHLSYPLPSRDIVDLARGKQLATPGKLPAEGDIEEAVADQVARAVELFHGGSDQWRAAVALPGEVVPEDDDDDPELERARLRGRRLLLIYPASSTEYQGSEVRTAPPLAALFDDGRVHIRSTRVAARIGKTAWMAANLTLSAGEAGDRFSVPMRGTYILEAQTVGKREVWRVVQAHISVPLSAEQIDRRVFGPAAEPSEPAVSEASE